MANDKKKGNAASGSQSNIGNPSQEVQGDFPGKQTVGDIRQPGGSMLGIPGAAPTEAGSLMWKVKNQDGSDGVVNIFESVFSDGRMNSERLEMVFNYMEASGKLDFTAFIEGIVYQGFDRLYYIKAALKKLSVSQFSRFAILGAVRGSNFDRIVERCLMMPADLTLLVKNNTVVKKANKRDDLTILRFTAAIPHWVAFWMFKVDIGKKIESQPCPGWLQFPGAASLPMSREVRLQHIAFCKAFSALLPGGQFNGNIYYTAFSNPIPVKDVPTMIKEGLGIGVSPGSLITSEEVRQSVSMEVARVQR